MGTPTYSSQPDTSFLYQPGLAQPNLSSYQNWELPFNPQSEADRLKEYYKKLGLEQYLKENPGVAYSGFLQGLDKPQQEYYSPRFNNLYNEYQGTLGSQAMQGKEPTGDFLSFLGGYDFNKMYQNLEPYQIVSYKNQGAGGADINRRYNELTSRQQGFYPASASPRTRFLNY